MHFYLYGAANTLAWPVLSLHIPIAFCFLLAAVLLEKYDIKTVKTQNKTFYHVFFFKLLGHMLWL